VIDPVDSKLEPAARKLVEDPLIARVRASDDVERRTETALLLEIG